jgi:hypothetical protein
MQGKYIYGDFCSGRISATWQENGSFDSAELLQMPGMITAFGEDPQGELLVADFKGGAIYRLITAPA